MPAGPVVRHGHLFALLVALVVPACRSDVPPSTTTPPGPTPGIPWFEDATAAAGIDFTHFDPTTPMYYIPETVGSGLGWIDYDADGWLDLFCIQDCPVRPEERVPPLPTHKLYRNNHDGTFTDVTQAAGLAVSGYGSGCAVGDYDNDGYDDLFITYLHAVALYANRPDGHGGRRFEDVTTASRITNPHWGTSCAWGDLDGDGRLDLYICNYSKIDLANYVPCENPNVRKRDICPPNVFPTVAHKVFRNVGDGTFADMSGPAGLDAAAGGYGFAVGMIDLDADGRQDAYVANDMKPAYLFHNHGKWSFTERGLLSGSALMAGGRFMAGMGVAIGDIDGSGRPSLIVSNYQDEPTMVFLNRGNMLFQEWSHPSGLGPATMKTLGFGVDLFDADLDGNLDAAIANGHVIKNAPEYAKAPYEQSGQVFVGDGQAHFREVSAEAGTYFREKRVGRGLAVGDYDNDGLPDLAYSHVGGPVKLLRNATATANRWVRLELVGGPKSNRNAVGAKVVIEASGRSLTRWVHGGGSYLSARDRRLTVGLGSATQADRVTVTWPSGARQEYRNLPTGRGWRLTEGHEQPEPSPSI